MKSFWGVAAACRVVTAIAIAAHARGVQDGGPRAMNRRTRAVAAASAGMAAGALAAAMWWSRPAGEVFASNFENVMGTSLEVRVESNGASAAQQAEQKVLGEIRRLSMILSGYDPDSEFSRWLRTSSVPTKVPAELIEVLSAFDEWRVRTGGALDPAVETASMAWRAAARDGRPPGDAELRTALARMRQPHWIVDRGSSTATRISDAPLMLNSFTKSFVADRAARRALEVPGVSAVLLNAGGDVIVRGRWTQTVGVADPVANTDTAPPMARLAVRDAVVATSGGYKRGFDIAGRHYSHILDPRTAHPAGHVLSATVVSANAIEAGALATAFCVLTPPESLALARTRPGVEFALRLDDGRFVESAGWRTLTVRPSRPSLGSPLATLLAAEQGASSPGWQLSVTLELARAQAMARRPYVAVWIEDKDRFPVRTLALWYDGKPRYLPELRAWYRADRLRALAKGSQIVDALTSATRAAGSYTLQWDGRDDSGKPVAAGTYTVCIEASREHGTYQIIRQAMDFPGTARHVALPGGTEISAASLDYQPAGR